MVCNNILPVLLVLAVAGSASSGQVDFYMSPNFVGLLSTGIPSNDPSQCFAFSSVARNQVSSAKVLDACVILFDEDGCKGRSIKLTEDARNISELEGNGTNDNFDKKAVAYRFCGSGEGEDDIKVDFYKEVSYEGSPVANYRDICRCISLPSSVLVDVSSIDNHHNCIELFTTSACETSPDSIKLFAGKSELSEDLTDSPIYQNMQSFIPCRIPSKCRQLTAKLFHFEIEDGSEEEIAIRSSSNALSMSAKTVVWNNGSATVSQEYSATRSVREVVEVETIDTHKTVQSWSTEKTTSTTSKTNFIFVSKTVTETLKETYSRTEEHESTRREKHTTDVLTEFTARQTIQINPCHYYEVESFVTVLENYPIFYKAFFRFSGTTAGQPMTAAELQRTMEAEGEFTFHEQIDEHTVSAYAVSNVTVSFGVETEIRGNGYRLRDCNTMTS